jgi:RimJ/RimL family protein N-acetyltransferase
MTNESSAPAKKILETDRLSLREMTIADAPIVVEILNEPAFVEFVADRGVRTNADAVKFIEEKFLPSYARYGFGFYLVELKESGTPIGMCGLIKRDVLEDVDIGFSIFERFWGKGYATEAARALMQHGLTKLGLSRIVGVTAQHNERSAAVLEKLGLRFEKMMELPGYTHPETRLFT